MKTIKTMLNKYKAKGFEDIYAESMVCQEIIINKLASSTMSNKVLLKGGIVMFNLTKDLRRATIDLDFDFIRYDISDASIKLFIDLLNRADSYNVVLQSIRPLHQEDYCGKRVWITISDKTASIDFKLDIGVHTLLAIEQNSACFYFDDDNGVTLKVNPPEQMFAEKLFSLAKHNVKSTRYKDIYDLYFFVKNNLLNKKVIKRCFESLLISKTHIKSVDDICGFVSKTFEDETYIKRFKNSKDKWLDVDYKTMFESILDFIYSI